MVKQEKVRIRSIQRGCLVAVNSVALRFIALAWKIYASGSTRAHISRKVKEIKDLVIWRRFTWLSDRTDVVLFYKDGIYYFKYISIKLWDWYRKDNNHCLWIFESVDQFETEIGYYFLFVLPRQYLSDGEFFKNSVGKYFCTKATPFLYN